MKKTTFVIFLALAVLKIQAQDYLISFSGTGITTEIGTIKVDNLTSGATVTLNGGDILQLSLALGIVSPDISNKALQIYPNPMTEQSTLTFIAPESGNAVICIVDLSGKTVYQISTLLSRGKHSFRISGITNGMYFVKVSGKNYACSTKLISRSTNQSQAVIEQVSSEKSTSGSLLKRGAATIDMPYTNGDQLLFKGISGIYSTIVTDVPASSKTITFDFAACTDNDGNNYTIVEIGGQTWMAENLNVGTKISGYGIQNDNGIIEKFCYGNSDSSCTVYGGLYQWDEAMQYVTTEGVKGICPTGWHLPTNGEWTTLTTYLGGESIAGGKMKETGTTHWLPPNTDATNSSGFTALSGGTHGGQGYFAYLYSNAFFLSSNAGMGYWDLYYNNQNLNLINTYVGDSFSVRCVKD
jgi:uncharacterized protein (TIGR02145 family)